MTTDARLPGAHGRAARMQLVMVRWAARATLLLGVTASGIANVLHAEPNFVARAISAWPPLALLLTVELISRVPVHQRALAIARMIAMTVIGLIAFGISYWHMAKVAELYGEEAAAAWTLPLTVDGLVIVASVSLIELNARIRLLETPAVQANPVPVTVKPVLTASVAGEVSRVEPRTSDRLVGTVVR